MSVTAVVANGPAASSQPINPESPQLNRVTEASKGIFQKTKEVFVRAWSAVVIGVTVGAEKVSFVFFRILEWIHPSLGPRVEVAFLRIANIWQSIKEAWRQDEIRNEINGLKLDNQQLRTRVTELGQAAQENEQLRVEVSRLSSIEQLSQTQEQRVQFLLQQHDNIAESQAAVIAQRDIVVLENTKLKDENVQFSNQRTGAVAMMNLSFAKQRELEISLNSIQQEVLDLRSLIQNNRELDQNFASIDQSCARLSPRSQQQQTEIDDGLKKLLPQLLKQMGEAREKLTEAKGKLVGHSAEIPLEGLERILNQLTKYLNRVPKAFQLHADWRQSVSQIIQNQPLVEV